MASTSKAAAYPTWLAREERQADRVVVAWDAILCSVTSGHRSCRILDFSHLGCRIGVDGAPSVGSHVSIAVPAFAEVVGWVAWRSGGQVGIDFAHPLPDAVLQGILLRNEGPPH